MRNLAVFVALLSFAFGLRAAGLEIRTPTANLRQGPAVEHRIVGLVEKGVRVTPLRIDKNYLEVSVGESGRRGWLYFPAQGWSADEVRARLQPESPVAAARIEGGGDTSAPAGAPAAVRAAVDERPAGAPDLALTTLAELGLSRGHLFEGLQAGHRKVFRFTLPRAAEVRGGMLRLGLSASAGLSERSVLRVDVNGEPVYSAAPSRLALAGGVSWVEVRVPRRLLTARDRGAVEVGISASLLASEDRCTDDRAAASFLHVDPASGLALDLAPVEGNLLAAWELLPEHVRLSLPAQADEHVFASALLLARELVREGKTVEVVRLPRVGDIVVAGDGELRRVFDAGGVATAALRAEAGPADARVVTLPDRRVLVFSAVDASRPVTLAAAGWTPLARAASHTVTQAAPIPARRLPATLDEASFDLLGADVSVRHVVETADWVIPLEVDRIPAGRVPEALRLVVTSAPVPDDQPMMLYAYLNEELQDVQRLTGGTQRFSLQLGGSAVRGTFNELRLVAQRDVREGDCKVARTGYPVQIERGSSVVFGERDGTPRDFGGLPRYFAGGFDLLVDAGVLERPETALVFLAHLFEANRYPLAAERIRVVTRGMKAPDGPFLLVGGADAVELGDVAVRFDKGQVVVRAHDDATLLDLANTRGISVAQLVEWGGARGLWVMPAPDGGLPASPALGLTFDSVAFFDDDGVVMTLSPELRDVARVAYPAYRSWFDLFGAYRYWLMALGWIAVVALLVQVFRKVRSHK